MSHSILNARLLASAPALALLVFPAVASGQTFGGASTTLYQWFGTAYKYTLGSSVSGAGDVDGDGFGDVIIGMPSDPYYGTSGYGAAYVRSGATGQLLHLLTGPSISSEFGVAVSGAGDVNADGFDDLVVGAPETATGGPTSSGSAFVYSGLDGSLLYKWDGSFPYGSFGNSVSGAGDVNNDGFDDVIIGERGARPGGMIGAGSAHIYSGKDGTQLYQLDGANYQNRFGISVSGAGDVNGDGFDDVIVGADLYSEPFTSAKIGAAYVYSGANGAQLHKWLGVKYSSSSAFGHAVSGTGDVNGDGYDDLLVGAYTEVVGGVYSTGAAYVYSGANGAVLYHLLGNPNTGFARSVGRAGDVDGDGRDDILVGTPTANSGGGNNSGAAYVYSGLSGNLIFEWGGVTTDDSFGVSVDGAGDVDGDGRDDLIFGAVGVDHSGLIDAGSAYVVSFNPFLSTSAQNMSLAGGGVLNLEFDFSSTAALDEYKLLISTSGTGPTSLGVDIPLTFDSFVISTYLGNYILANTNLQGNLDASGQASGTLTFPPGLSPSLAGSVFYLAAIANAPGQLPEFSSVPVTLKLIP